jgi:hypothetical protein
MSKLLGVLICASVCLVLGLGAAGCTKKTEKDKKTTTTTTTTTTGDKGTTTGTDKTTTTEKTTTTTTTTESAKKFTLKAPADVSIDQGGTAKVDVGITREKGFADAVDVKFDDLPKGVTVEKNGSIGKDVSDHVFTLKAADDAPKADNHAVKVSAAGGGATHDATFKVTVKEKKK